MTTPLQRAHPSGLPRPFSAPGPTRRQPSPGDVPGLPDQHPSDLERRRLPGRARPIPGGVRAGFPSAKREASARRWGGARGGALRGRDLIRASPPAPAHEPWWLVVARARPRPHCGVLCQSVCHRRLLGPSVGRKPVCALGMVSERRGVGVGATRPSCLRVQSVEPVKCRSHRQPPPSASWGSRAALLPRLAQALPGSARHCRT